MRASSSLSFEDFFLLFVGKLSGNNRWIKLHALIPWDELDDNYASQFCSEFGAPACGSLVACMVVPAVNVPDSRSCGTDSA